MTTVAYRAGVLATDSRQSSGGNILTDLARKFVRLPSSQIAVSVGNANSCAAFVETLRNGAPDTAKLDYSSCVLVIEETGAIRHASSSGIMDLDPKDFYAFGSGQQAALAAMHMGASAAEAVRIAKKVDAFTGGKVITLKAGSR